MNNSKSHHFHLLLTALFMSLLLAGPCFSATEGSLGATSTGSSDLTITIGYLVRITGLNAIDFGTYDFSSVISEDDDVCVYTNDSSGEYTVTATGDGDGNRFQISDGTDLVDYDVYWNDESGTTGNVKLTSQMTSGTQTGASTTSEICFGVGGPTANVQIRIGQASITPVPAGDYAGVLTLLIEPVD